MWDTLPIRRKPFLILAKYKTHLKRLWQQMVFRRAFLLQEGRTSNTRPGSWSDTRGKGRRFTTKRFMFFFRAGLFCPGVGLCVPPSSSWSESLRLFCHVLLPHL